MLKKRTLLFIFTFLLAATALAAPLPLGLQRLIAHQQGIAQSITFLAAFLAGLISFTSPCGFVLLPTFFSYAFQEKKKALTMSSFFSLGLLLGFTIVGLIAGLLGDFFNNYKLFMAVVSGILMIVFAFLLFFNKGFSIFTPCFNPEKKNVFGIFVFGFLFAFGWTPCTFTILSGILLLAGLSGSLFKATLLLVLFGLGVIVPFLIVSYFSDRFDLTSKIQGRPRELHFFGRKILTNRYNIFGSVFLFFLGMTTIYYQGTQFFQITFTSLTPWSLDFTNNLNDTFLRGFFASSIANWIGILLALTLLLTLFFLVKKSFKIPSKP